MAGEVWSLIESAGSGLHQAATKVAAETTRLGNLLDGTPCGVIVTNGRAVEDELAPFGLQKLYLMRPGASGLPTPEAYAHALTALVSKRQPYLVLFGATAFGSEVAARVSARLGTGLISNCIDFAREDQRLIARKAVHNGKAHLTMTWSAPPPHIATVELEALEAIEEKSRAPIEVIEETVEGGQLGTELIGRWKTEPGQLDLTEASLVIGVGQPILSRIEELPRLREAAEKVGAVFGCSRPVADAGALPKDKQIGASGKWLNAEVYIACAISGSSYHMIGVRGVRHLVAVNTDRNAPILKHAELGVVGDMFEILPALEKLSDGDEREPQS